MMVATTDKPSISPRSGSYHPNRQWETTLARLRIGHTRLTHSYLRSRSNSPPHAMLFSQPYISHYPAAPFPCLLFPDPHSLSDIHNNSFPHLFNWRSVLLRQTHTCLFNWQNIPSSDAYIPIWYNHSVLNSFPLYQSLSCPIYPPSFYSFQRSYSIIRYHNAIWPLKSRTFCSDKELV